jgi:hypothetical protein
MTSSQVIELLGPDELPGARSAARDDDDLLPDRDRGVERTFGIQR